MPTSIRKRPDSQTAWDIFAAAVLPLCVKTIYVPHGPGGAVEQAACFADWLQEMRSRRVSLNSKSSRAWDRFAAAMAFSCLQQVGRAGKPLTLKLAAELAANYADEMLEARRGCPGVG